MITKSEAAASGTVSRVAKSATVLYAKVSTYMGRQMCKKLKDGKDRLSFTFTLHLSPG